MGKKRKISPLRYLQGQQEAAILELKVYERKLSSRKEKDDPETMRRLEVAAILAKDRISELARYIDYIKQNF